ncbi:hypothetical protein WJX73_001163 [Symbiochloris irregularis]|uniref:Uncharacterized protein n=1 Tax=Symbiochloris irregularis TaxID=706552 RepID=A0AAW1P6A8_9CHLO
MASLQNLAQLTPRRQTVVHAAGFPYKGKIGLPLAETQKTDPTDVRAFWKAHPISNPGKINWEDDYDADLMREWDNGPFGMEGFDLTKLTPDMTGLPMSVGVLENFYGTGWAVPDRHMKVSQHPGQQLDMTRCFFVTLETEPRVTGNPGFTTPAALSLVIEFIQVNLKLLLEFWDHKHGSKELEENVKRVPSRTDQL